MPQSYEIGQSTYSTSFCYAFFSSFDLLVSWLPKNGRNKSRCNTKGSKGKNSDCVFGFSELRQ